MTLSMETNSSHPHQTLDLCVSSVCKSQAQALALALWSHSYSVIMVKPEFQPESPR